MSAQPTPDDILDEARAAGIDWHKHWNDDGTNRLETFARAVLSRWGTPATGGEPDRYMDDRGYTVSREWLESDEATSDYRAVYTTPLYTSPQPVRKPMPKDVAKLVQAAQAFVLEPTSLKKKIELEAQAWGPLADTPQPVREPLSEVAAKFEAMHANGDVWITSIAAAQLVRGITGGQHGTDA